MEDTCPGCGEELDDFSPCGCLTLGMADKPKRKRQSQQIAYGGMRGMVARKLAREQAKKENVG